VRQEIATTLSLVLDRSIVDFPYFFIRSDFNINFLLSYEIDSFIIKAYIA